MTYRELVAQQDALNLNSPLLAGEQELGPWQDFMKNQSPIIKVWLVVMLVNLIMFLFLMH
jgi:hypothetical protein